MKKFTPEQLERYLYGGEDVVEDRLIDHQRWSVVHSLVFKHDGKLYRTSYEQPATESQDCDPWGYRTEVECEEVQPVEKTVTVYEAVTVGGQ